MANEFYLAINGYGRIGQAVLRAIYEEPKYHRLKIIAINELKNLKTLTYLTRYDTTYGQFPKSVASDDNHLIINNEKIKIYQEKDPKYLDWQSQNIDLLLECSGSFSDYDTADAYIKSGPQRLLFSQPAQANVDATVVYGINHQILRSKHRIISAASCTTNCIVPVLKVLNDRLGVDYGMLTTLHSAMNDQPVIDGGFHGNLRLTRSALYSMIPVETALPKGIYRILPELEGRFEATSVRVPTINVSCIDLCVWLNKNTSIDEINQLFIDVAVGELSAILDVTSEPNASIDFNHNNKSCIVDCTQTRVSGKRMVKLLCWFDNEWSFANRMLDVANYWLSTINHK